MYYISLILWCYVINSLPEEKRCNDSVINVSKYKKKMHLRNKEMLKNVFSIENNKYVI